MSYRVSTEVYEGPLDVLLRLIVADEVDLYSISLVELVGAFLAEMERIFEASRAAEAEGSAPLHLDTATEFVLVAATLIELKTRRLLPDADDGDLDEELALWEERDLLLHRLLECTTFKAAAGALRGLMEQAARCRPRTAGLEDRFLDIAPDLLARVDVEDLRAVARRALAPRPVITVDTSHLAPIRTSVAEAVVEVADELARAGRLSFRALTGGLVERMEVIIRFLAVLELFKQGRCEIDQPRPFADIEISWLDRPVTGEDRELVAVDAYDG
jgi:segregation and condensation protein A